MPVKLDAPVGVPGFASLQEEADWSTLVENQLADVRKTAENWRTGLATLLGLLTSFSLIKGPSDLGSLSSGAAYAAGGFLLLAIVCAVAGTWSAIEAAYGSPDQIDRNEFRALGGLAGYKLALSKKTSSNLHSAQHAMIASLICAAIAIGMVWYGPRGLSVSLNVELLGAPKMCGKLIGSGDGFVDISPSSSTPKRIYMVDISRLTVAKECP
jgi:hypothetical protein